MSYVTHDEHDARQQASRVLLREQGRLVRTRPAH